MFGENAGYQVPGHQEIENLCRVAERNLDPPLMESILSRAPGVGATFPRAFEEFSDPASGIAALKTLPRFDRILTRGAGADLVGLAPMPRPRSKFSQAADWIGAQSSYSSKSPQSTGFT
jgi:copper homeostasis protein CutC